MNTRTKSHGESSGNKKGSNRCLGIGTTRRQLYVLNNHFASDLDGQLLKILIQLLFFSFLFLFGVGVILPWRMCQIEIQARI